MLSQGRTSDIRQCIRCGTFTDGYPGAHGEYPAQKPCPVCGNAVTAFGPAVTMREVPVADILRQLNTPKHRAYV